VALLVAIENDHIREAKGVCSRGRRELLNLQNSINYDSTGTSSRWEKGKAHIF
jgi:hypothetical protein